MSQHAEARLAWCLVDNRYIPCTVKSEAFEEVTVTTDGEQEVIFPKANVFARNPAEFDRVEHIACLPHVNEPSILHCLYSRLKENHPYTYSGRSSLIYMHCTETPNEVHTSFEAFHLRSRTAPPHIYAVADAAYTSMLLQSRNQSILLLGESGSGKSRSAEKLTDYLVHASALAPQPTPSVPSSLHTKIHHCNEVLKAFGNAVTTLNSDSSRFGKLLEFQYSYSGEIIGAKIETFSLEITRCVSQHPGERNFHIFYQLLSGANADLSSKLHLDTADRFLLLNQGNVGIQAKDDAIGFERTQNSLAVLGFSEDEQLGIWCVLAGLLHLGNVKMLNVEGEFTKLGDLSVAASLLGIDCSSLQKALTSPHISSIQTSSTPPTQPTREIESQHPLSAPYSFQELKSLVKLLYNALLLWVVKKINSTICSNRVHAHSINIVDMSGFQNLDHNGFDQLLFNYSNDVIQQFFNKFSFQDLPEEYKREGLDWTHNAVKSESSLDLVYDATHQPPRGIFSVLENHPGADNSAQCTICANSSAELECTETVLHELQKNYTREPLNSEKGREAPNQGFYLWHPFGRVCYNVCGWVAQNCPVQLGPPTLHTNLVQCLHESTNSLLCTLLTADNLGTIQPCPGIGFQLAQQLQSLVTRLSQSNPHFIHCIKCSNVNTETFNEHYVLSRLKSHGIIEEVKVSAKGFPFKFSYNDLLKRYGLLCVEATSEPKRAAASLLSQNSIPTGGYKLGHRSIFLKAFAWTLLEEKCKSKLMELVSPLQAVAWALLCKRNLIRPALPDASTVEPSLKEPAFGRTTLEDAEVQIQDMQAQLKEMGEKERERLLEISRYQVQEAEWQKEKHIFELEKEEMLKELAKEHLHNEQKEAEREKEKQMEVERERERQAEKLREEERQKESVRLTAERDSSSFDYGVRRRRTYDNDTFSENPAVLTRKLDASEREKNQALQALKKLQAEMDSYKTTIKNLTDSKTTAEQTIKQRENSISVHKEQIEQLQRANSTLERKLASSEKELVTRTTEFDEQRRTHMTAERRRRTTESDLETAKADLTSKQAELSRTITEKDTIKKDLAEMKSKLSSEIAAKERLQEQTAWLTRNCEEAKKEVEVQRDAVAKLGLMNAELKRDISTLEIEVKMSTKRSETASEARQTLESEYKALRAKYDDLKSQWGDEVERLKAECDVAKKGENSALSEALARKKAESENGLMRERISELEGALQQSREKAQELETKAADLEHSVMKYQCDEVQSVATANREVASRSAEVHYLQTDLRLSQEAQRKTETTCSTLSTELAALKEETTNYSHKLENCEAEKRNLEEQLANVKDRCESLESELRDTKKSLSTLGTSANGTGLRSSSASSLSSTGTVPDYSQRRIQSQLSSALSQLDDERRAHSETESTLKTIKMQLENSKVTLKDVQLAREKLVNDMRASEASLNEMRLKYSSAEDSISHLQESLAETQADLKDLRKKVQGESDGRQRADNARSKVERELQELQKLHETTENELHSVKQELNKMKRKEEEQQTVPPAAVSPPLAERSYRFRRVVNELSQSSVAVSNNNGTSAREGKLAEEVTQLYGKVDAESKARQAAEQSVRELTEQLQQEKRARARVEGERGVMQTSLTEIQASLEQGETERTSLVRDKSFLEAERDELKKQIHNLDQTALELESCTRQLAEMKLNLSIEKSKREEGERSLVAMQAEAEKALHKIETVAQEQSAHGAELRALERQLTETKTAQTLTQSSLTQAESRLKSEQELSNQLQTQLEQNKEKHEALQTRLRELELKNDLLNQDYRRERKSNEVLEARVNELLDHLSKRGVTTQIPPSSTATPETTPTITADPATTEPTNPTTTEQTNSTATEPNPTTTEPTNPTTTEAPPNPENAEPKTDTSNL
ncbi:myosin II heavy chain [Pelomyxa schiedti]|nr:myosin II heavy chain [Pelomyxa schiedti]